MRDWLRHAFAIEPASAFTPSTAEVELVSRLATELSRRNLTLPASVLLESFRPFGYVSAQLLWSTYPWFAALTDASGLQVLAGLLERPGAVDYLLDRLQAADEAVNVPADEVGAIPVPSPPSAGERDRVRGPTDHQQSESIR